MKMLSNRTGGWIPALIFAVLMIMTGGSVTKVNAQDYYDDSYSNYGDYQEFYDDLSPYGQWFNDPQYGYVWTPNVGSGFRPYYTNGYWAMTDYGNMWMSDYPWGWAAFHYGRWAQSGVYGWIWIPGRTWGPAWVSWRQGGGYYGWAPMGPGISINISFGSGYNVPTPWWTFIPCGNIYARDYSRYYAPRRTVNIINNTTIINNTYVDNRSRSTYISGPRRSDIEAVTRQRVPVYSVNNRTRAGVAQVSGREVSVYRPAIRTVNSNGNNRAMPAPRQVKTMERSVITNAGGGRPPAQSPVSRQTMQQGQRSVQPDQQMQRAQAQPQRVERNQQQMQQRGQPQQQIQRDQQMQQQRAQQQQIQRDQQMQQQRAQQQQIQRDQQMQQQRAQQQQIQRDQQMQQQRAQQQQIQRDQQMQQQRAQQQQMQRDQQMQQQRAQQQQIQRDQQMQQQRAQQQQMQRDQQMQQQRMQQQQMQQQRAQQQQQMQQQRSVERAQPQQREDRSAPRGR